MNKPSVVALVTLLAAGQAACNLRKELGPKASTKPPAASGAATPSPDPGTASTFTEAQLNGATDVTGYANYCKQELGLPAATLASWNCLTGKEIPVTVEGQPLNAANYAQLSAGTVGCDLQSWLGAVPCSNYAFVQQRQLSADVSATLLCRMRAFGSPQTYAARLADAQANLTVDTFNALYAFDSFGLIWTSKSTGKTCFFDVVGQVYGGYVASPDDEAAPALAALPDPKPPAAMQAAAEAPQIWQKNGRAVWRSPTQVASVDDCVRCHDTGALKGSPWIEQVFPVAVNDPAVPYIVIGSAFDQWKQRLPVGAISTVPVAGGTTCTGCHRIGSQSSCSPELDFATGVNSPGKLSTLGASFFYKTWMPPAPASWHGKSDSELSGLWSAANQAAVTRLKCCCQTPSARGCYYQDITQSPLAAPVAGTGVTSCL